MNGAHDMGGMHGFGPVVAEQNEPVFHAEWERRVFALTLATGFLGRWNIDMTRFYRENRPPADYLDASYYELWLKGLEGLLVDRGLVTADELRTGRAKEKRDPSLRVPDVVAARKLLVNMTGAKVDVAEPARFATGDRVRVANRHPATHTRMPRYCRGKIGVVNSDHGVYIYPDTHAHDLGRKPQHLYNVRFSAEELWGERRPDSVMIDLWDDYLVPA